MNLVLKKLIQSFFPNSLWRRIRYAMIIEMQKKCKTELDWLVGSDYSRLLLEIKPQKEFLDSRKIVWQYWAQGFDSSSMPDLVKVCLKSVEKYTQDYTLLRISDENLDEYIEVPDWLRDKMVIISKAHFSDLLRCILLSQYGGLWLDASVFLTGDIPEYVYKSGFFMYRRDNSEKYKRYWENTFAYYWGWSSEFSVKSLIGIMYAKKGNRTISDLSSILLAFWKKYNYSHNYFFFQILIEAYFKRFPELMPEIVNDTIPHLLRQYINEKPAPGYSISDILQTTTIHSLNYKNNVACENLLALFPEYRKFLN